MFVRRTVFEGREVIESSHRALFEGPLKGSKLTGALGGVAKVLVREEGEWLITAFQNTRVSDPRG